MTPDPSPSGSPPAQPSMRLGAGRQRPRSPAPPAPIRWKTARRKAAPRGTPPREAPGREVSSGGWPGWGWPGSSLALAGLLGWALLLGTMAGCASTSDVKKVEETNRVQDQRLRALEEDIAATLNTLQTQVKALRTQAKALQGQMNLMKERTVRMEAEQNTLNEYQERSKALQRKLMRTVEEEVTRIGRFKIEAENDLDKMRLQLGQLEKLLKSPISKLPDKTSADKEFRAAYFFLINGELDLAASRFAKFRKTYPKDKRSTEALYRRGQAFFLMRKYDHALEPFFAVVEKSPKHPLAVSSRWMLARSLEETGELKLSRGFYAQLITGKTIYANDASRRIAFIDKLYPRARKKRK